MAIRTHSYGDIVAIMVVPYIGEQGKQPFLVASCFEPQRNVGRLARCMRYPSAEIGWLFFISRRWRRSLSLVFDLLSKGL